MTNTDSSGQTHAVKYDWESYGAGRSSVLVIIGVFKFLFVLTKAVCLKKEVQVVGSMG